MAATKSSPKAYVIDASAVISQLLPEKTTASKLKPIFNQFQSHRLSFFAPELLKYEVANVLKTSILRHKISPVASHQLLHQFLKLNIKYESVNFALVLKLAVRLKLSVYDAAYVYLAQNHHLPLLSLDRTLAKLVLQP